VDYSETKLEIFERKYTTLSPKPLRFSEPNILYFLEDTLDIGKFSMRQGSQKTISLCDRQVFHNGQQGTNCDTWEIKKCFKML